MPALTPKYPPVSPQLYVVGMDAELYLSAHGPSGNDVRGEFCYHVSTWQLEGTFADEQEQPPGNQLVMSIVTGVSFRLSLTESVIRTGDRFFLETIMKSIYEGQIPQFAFTGRVGTRIVPTSKDGTGPADSKVSTCSINFCQPTGAFDLMNVRPGGILRRALNFNVNSVPYFEKDGYL